MSSYDRMTITCVWNFTWSYKTVMTIWKRSFIIFSYVYSHVKDTDNIYIYIYINISCEFHSFDSDPFESSVRNWSFDLFDVNFELRRRKHNVYRLSHYLRSGSEDFYVSFEAVGFCKISRDVQLRIWSSLSMHLLLSFVSLLFNIFFSISFFFKSFWQ